MTRLSQFAKSYYMRLLWATLLLIGLIDHLAGARSEFCTDTKRAIDYAPFRVTRWFSLRLSLVSCTHFHTPPRPSTRYHASISGIKSDCQIRSCIITHVRERAGDRPYASYPYFPPGTMLIIILLIVSVTRLRNQNTCRKLSSYWNRLFVDYTYLLILTRSSLSSLSRLYHYFNYSSSDTRSLRMDIYLLIIKY